MAHPRSTTWSGAPRPRSSFRSNRRQEHLVRWVLAAAATSMGLHFLLWAYADELGLPDYFGRLAPVAAEDRIPVDLRRARINEEAALQPDTPLPTPAPVERDIPPPTTEPVDLTQFKDLKFEELRLTAEVPVPTNIVASKAPAAGSISTSISSQLEAIPVAATSNALSEQIQSATRSGSDDPVISKDQVMIPLQDDVLAGSDVLGDSIAAATRKGAGGTGDDDGFASLDDLINYSGPITDDRTAMMPTDLLFEYNSSELKDGARLSLMKLGFIIQKNPDATISIEGHTDSIGGDDYNQRLSEARAEAVKNWLVESLRFDAARLHTRGWGKQKLLVPGGDATAQQKNRRVEIVIKPKR